MAPRMDPISLGLVIRRTRRSRRIALRTWLTALRGTRGVRAVPAGSWSPPGFRYQPGDAEVRSAEGRWSHAYRWRAPGEIEVVTNVELVLAREMGELDQQPTVRVARRLASKLGAELVEERRAATQPGFGAGEWLRPVSRADLRMLTRQSIFRFERASTQPAITLDEWRSAVGRFPELRWLDEKSERGVWRYGAALRRYTRHPNNGRLFQWCRGSVVIQRDILLEYHWFRSRGGPDAISDMCRRMARLLRADIHTFDGHSPDWASPPLKPRRGLAR